VYKVHEFMADDLDALLFKARRECSILCMFAMKKHDVESSAEEQQE
jgi:hypothetical protein